MRLFQLLFVSFCCIVSLSCLGAEHAEQSTSEKDKTTTTTTALQQQAQSAIYKIRRLNTKDKQSRQHKLQHVPQQQQQQQQLHKDMTTTATVAEAAKSPRTKKFKNLAKSSHGLNKKLLSKLGFTKVKAPNSHNRKRLAIESRRHASPDDSHVFIIKLPPNFHYYASPHKMEQQPAAHPNALQQQQQTKVNLETADAVAAPTAMLNANGKKVSFPFNSNGKPGRIYHWNLPIIKKMLEEQQRFANVASATKDQLIDIKDIPTWTKPWENETVEKSSYGKSSKMNYKKSLKRKSPSYYAPANAVNKNSFNKYFAGNGKPKGFYLIKENQKKPLFYKNIVS